MWPVGRRYTWSEECEGVIVYLIVPEGDVLVAVQLAINMNFVHCDDSLGATIDDQWIIFILLGYIL